MTVNYFIIDSGGHKALPYEISTKIPRHFRAGARFLVLQALQGCGDAAASCDEVEAGLIVDGHNGSGAQ